MTLRIEGDTARILGPAGVEEAEPLLAFLAAGGRAVDLTAAGPLHTAVFQLLLARRPALLGPAADPFTARWLAPLLARTGPG